jgi:serine protease AprX
VILLLLSFAVGFLMNGTAAAQERHSKLDRVLRDAVRSDSNSPRRVIVQTRPGARAAVRNTLQAHGDAVEAEHPAIDALTVTLHQEDLTALAADPSILAVSVDATVTSFGYGDSAKRSARRSERNDRNGNARDKNERSENDRRGGYHRTLNVLRASLGVEDSSFSGAGVNVAIIDSGIAPNRDLASSIAGFWDFTRGGIPTRAYDDYGHGTHVAGLIASNGREYIEYSGVAPSVRLYGLKVLDKEGRGRTSDVVRALEWIAANKRSSAPGAVKIDIVNLSLGHPVYEPAASDPLVRAVEKVTAAGVLVVTAAGNQGSDERGEIGHAGINSPANAPSAVTVGAVDTGNTPNRRDDRVAFFSSRGPTWFDGFAKPEIVAPGVALTSDAADPSELYSVYPQLLKGGSSRRLATLSGTSMAAATAAGVAALALEASRSANHGHGLTPNALKAVLQYTAITVRESDGRPFDALAQGAGQVNGGGAVALALAINPEMPLGHRWLRSDVRRASVIYGDWHAWSEALVWNDSIVRKSDVMTVHSQLWDDNLVWGTGCDTDDAQCVTTVWGAASDVDNIVWGTGLAWAEDLVFRNRVIGLFLGEDNIVWGTLAGLTEDNIVWGTLVDADNIVWGTLRGDNIVWGTLRGDNIVWGTLSRGDNIVWGTLRGDNIVWGTLDGPEGGRQ